MKLTQKWVGYLDRSYEQIKARFFQRIRQVTPEITDFSETNPFIILAGFFSGIGENLHLYIDATAREVFLGTARRYTSMIKLAYNMDYRVKAAVGAYGVIVITNVDSNGDPITPASAITIPEGTVVSTPDGSLLFRTTQASVIPTNKTHVEVGIKQWTDQVTSEVLGVSNGQPGQFFSLPDNYLHGSAVVTIGGDTWKIYPSFAYMGGNTKGFIVDVRLDGGMYIFFGDGLNGAIPPLSTQIFVDYKTTEGVISNTPPNTITTLVSSFPGLTLTVTNPDYTVGGSNIEGTEDIRKNAPLLLATQDRAVTYSDYGAIATLHPGVGHAIASYCCANRVTLYIAPKTRGIAPQPLLTEVGEFIGLRRIMGRGVTVVPAGITRLFLKVNIIANPGYTEQQTLSEVYEALNNEYGYSQVAINSLIDPSTINAQLKELDSVRSISIEKVYLEPYARPNTPSIVPLKISYTPIASTSTIDYRIVYDGPGDIFMVYKNHIYFGSIAAGAPFADGSIIGFTITDTGGDYQDGDNWTFRVYPSYPEVFSNYTLQVTDFTQAIIDIDYDNLVGGLPTVFGDYQVQTSASVMADKCKPNC